MPYAKVKGTQCHAGLAGTTMGLRRVLGFRVWDACGFVCCALRFRLRGVEFKVWGSGCGL